MNQTAPKTTTIFSNSDAQNVEEILINSPPDSVAKIKEQDATVQQAKGWVCKQLRAGIASSK